MPNKEEQLIWDGVKERFQTAVNALVKSGIKPADIRIACGVSSPATWSTYTNGRTTPPITVIIRMMTEYGVDTAYLMANRGLHNDESFKAKLVAWMADPKIDTPKRGRPPKPKTKKAK